MSARSLQPHRPKNDAGMKSGDHASLLEASHLCLGYGGARVLDDVSLHLPRQGGRVVGLRGPNGAGKSTFIRSCLGLHAPESGSIRLLDATPGRPGFGSVLAGVGYVPQSRAAGQFRLTVAEVVGLGRYGRIGFMRRGRQSDRDAVAAAMRRAGVDHLLSKAVQELSGGQYQRVAIARAIAAEPELYVMDEPVSHLDAGGRAGIVELIASLASERAASMLLVSHDPELLALCDSYIDFDNGHAGLGNA